MLNINYKMENHDKRYLETHGFRPFPLFSGEDETVYVHRFPAYKYRENITFDGRICVVMETGDTRIDIIDNSDGSLYAPWYYEDNDAHEKLTDKIKKRVELEMKRIGVQHAKYKN